MTNPRVALFVIDMQETYVGKSNKYGYESDLLLTAVNARIRKAKAVGELVIYIKNVATRKNGEFIPELATGLEMVSHQIIEKRAASVFSNPLLVEILNANKVTHIEVVGVDGNCCVASSALDAAKAGYSVTFPLHCIGIRNMQRFQKTQQRLTEKGIAVVD